MTTTNKTDAQMQLEQQNLKKQLLQIKDNEEMATWLAQQTQEKQDSIIALEKAAEDARPYFKEVEDYLKNVLKFTGQESYKEYSTSMMTLYGQLLIWLQAEVANKTLSRIGSEILSFKFGIGDYKISGELITNGIKQLAHSAKASVLYPPTPNVRYDIEIDKDGKLLTEVIMDGKPSSGDTKAVFDKAFGAWLDQCPDSEWTIDNNNIITNSNGKPMQMTDLQALNRDDKTNLAAFFRGQLDFKITPLVQSQIENLDGYSSPKP